MPIFCLGVSLGLYRPFFCASRPKIARGPLVGHPFPKLMYDSISEISKQIFCYLELWSLQNVPFTISNNLSFVVPGKGITLAIAVFSWCRCKCDWLIWQGWGNPAKESNNKNIFHCFSCYCCCFCCCCCCFCCCCCCCCSCYCWCSQF